jgi:ABC-type Fe3+/spermidine/putrescine transport system ATPase subunit
LHAWLSCRGIAKTLGAKRVLNGLDLQAEQGQIISILGPSGSGKTTLIRLIAGLDDPDAGEIEIAGRSVWSRHARVKTEHRGVGLVFQDYALWPHMTVADNVAFGLGMAGLGKSEREARVREVLQSVDLGEHAERFPDQLSGGQQQRVALARCLAVRPHLILMDEPLSNLDAALRESLRLEILEIVRAYGVTVIYITHDQSEAMALSDRMAVINDGRILQVGTPDELYHRPSAAFVASFLGGVNLITGALSTIAGDTVFSAEGLSVRVVNGARPASSAMALLLRPEDAAPAERYPQNRLAGQVRSCSFIGRCWRIGIDVAGHQLRLDWPGRVQLGDLLAFSVSPERCTLVPLDS